MSPAGDRELKVCVVLFQINACHVANGPLTTRLPCVGSPSPPKYAAVQRADSLGLPALRLASFSQRQYGMPVIVGSTAIRAVSNSQSAARCHGRNVGPQCAALVWVDPAGVGVMAAVMWRRMNPSYVPFVLRTLKALVSWVICCAGSVRMSKRRRGPAMNSPIHFSQIQLPRERGCRGDCRPRRGEQIVESAASPGRLLSQRTAGGWRNRKQDCRFVARCHPSAVDSPQ